MKIAVLSSFTTSLFWFRVDMMQSFQRAGYEVLAVGDGDEAEWADRFAGLGIRYRQIPVQRNGTNPSAIKPEELQPYIDDGSVEYVGEQKDVQPYLRACTAYVLPSYHEGTPKTVLEAMACGRPAITTGAPGCRETVTDGVNGFLVPVKDVDAIVDAMQRILDEPENTAAMAKAARQMAEDVFDVHKVNLKIRQTMDIGD